MERGKGMANPTVCITSTGNTSLTNLFPKDWQDIPTWMNCARRISGHAHLKMPYLMGAIILLRERQTRFELRVGGKLWSS